jgi:hypothetical protein
MQETRNLHQDELENIAVFSGFRDIQLSLFLFKTKRWRCSTLKSKTLLWAFLNLLEQKISMFEIFPYVAYTNLSNLIWLQ